MPHFVKRPVKRTWAKDVAPEWLEKTTEVSRLVNLWASRRDLTAYLGVDGGRGMAAALYDPNGPEIEVNTIQAFGEFVLPTEIGDLTSRETHFEYPKAIGAILHEAGHAAYTTRDMCYSFEKLDQGPNHWFDMLDEPRIEGLMARKYPENREFLRSCALEIVLKDTKETIKELTYTAAAAQVAVLAFGRVDAGVLKKKDTKHIRKAVLKVIPIDVLHQMRALWLEFLELRGEIPAHLERMFEIAIEFDKLVTDQSEKNGDPKPGEGGEGGDLAGILGDILDALGGDRVNAEFDAANEAWGQQIEEREQRAQQQKQTDMADRAKNKAIADNTFMTSNQNSNGQAQNGSHSTLIRQRPPTDEERAVAGDIARRLRAAKYRDRLVTKTSRPTPPGKLRTSTAMQATAARKAGVKVKSEPWAKKTRHHVEDPNLTVGIMCDISSSMRMAMEPIAVSAWVMSDAARRIKATAASVYYGYDIFSVLNPGEYLRDVHVYSASDGVEVFDKGFRALDGGLNLLDGHGARILVVCSDGQYGGSGEAEAARKWLKRCRDSGVAVLWLDYRDSPAAIALCEETGATRVKVGTDVVAAAEAIGQACQEALTRASR